jgi:hypothetical protein
MYKFHKDVDVDFNVIATDAEIKFFNENKKQIKRNREKSKQKDEELCRSDDSNFYEEIKTPVPNPHHMHCGVCKMAFQEYKDHLKSKEHLTNVSLQEMFYKMIDTEIDDINNIKKWEPSPIISEASISSKVGEE